MQEEVSQPAARRRGELLPCTGHPYQAHAEDPGWGPDARASCSGRTRYHATAWTFS